MEDFELNIDNYFLFADNLSTEGDYELRIHWEDYESDLNPTQKLRFLLVDEGANSTNSNSSSGGRKMIMQSVKKLVPRGWYFWENDLVYGEGVRFYKYDKKVPSNNSNGNGSSSELSGKWYQVNACTNSAGQKNFFNFSSASSGTIGQIDCANSCSDSGTYTQFNYSISNSNVSITPLSVSDFCGVSPKLASPFTVAFSITDNTLILDGQTFEK